MSHRKFAVLQPAPPDNLTRSTVQPQKKRDEMVDYHSHQPTRKRASINANGACEPCRKGKRRVDAPRCDGMKPTCGACLKRDINHNRCLYDQVEGLSRAETLKLNAKMLKAERDTLRTFVKDLLSVAPETTIQDGRRLAEKRGSLLPSALRLEIDDIIRQKLPSPKRCMNLCDDSIMTPMSHSGPSSPDLDVSYQTSMLGSSCSPSALSISPTFNQPRVPQGTFSEKRCPPPEDRSDTAEVHTRRRLESVNKPYSSSLQALSAMCVGIAQEHSRNPSLTGSPVNDQPPSRTSNSLHIYAYTPLPSITNPNGYEGWSEEIPIQNPQILNFQIPLYMVQPLQCPDNSPLSQTIVGFLELARARVKQGWPLLDILGPINFDVSRLTSPEYGYNPHYDVFSVPEWATSVAMTFPETSTVVRLSLVLSLARVMRWFIAPTPDNYALIPESQRPTPLQRMMPHKAELDILMLPALRDALITKPREYIEVYFNSAKCDWSEGTPYVEVDPRTNSLVITAAFERHVSNVDNWYFESNLLQMFPELHGKCNHPGSP